MSTTTRTGSTISAEDVDHLIHANHWNPFEVLGPHTVGLDGGEAVAVRAFLPEAREVWVVDLARGEPGVRHAMERVHPDGVFEAVFPGRGRKFPYRLAVENYEGHAWEF